MEYAFTNMCSSSTRYFSQEIWCTNSEEIDLHVHGKKIHSFYAFELLMQFLVEEGCIQIFF